MQKHLGVFSEQCFLSRELQKQINDFNVVQIKAIFSTEPALQFLHLCLFATVIHSFFSQKSTARGIKRFDEVFAIIENRKKI